MPKLPIILLLLFFQVVICFGQDEAEFESSVPDSSFKETFILGGYNYSSGHLIDVGFAFRNWSRAGYHSIESNVAFSNEFLLADKLIIGPKISGWIAGGAAGIAMGITLINYTDFNRHELNFRPEIGIGLFGTKVTYGYNAKLWGNGFDGISNHSVYISLPLARFSR